MNRISSLPFAEWCGAVAGLMAKHGSGRAALMGSAFHAVQAGNGEAWLLKLTADERNEIAEWHPVDDWLIDGVTLRYSEGVVEADVALTRQGLACEADHPDCITVGHVDVHWFVPEHDCVYVVDIKRSKFTVQDGPASLQLQAYGFALAQKYGARYYRPAIWAAMEGEMLDGERVDLQAFEAASVWARIEHAATNDGEPVTGGYCTGCYVRDHCPDQMLPAAYATLESVDPELRHRAARALTVAAKGELTAADAIELVQLADAAKGLSERLKEAARAYATKATLRDPVTGKVYARVICNGRERSLKPSELRAKMGANAEHLIIRGSDYDQWRWINPRR